MDAVAVALIGIGAFLIYDAVKSGNTNPKPLQLAKSVITGQPRPVEFGAGATQAAVTSNPSSSGSSSTGGGSTGITV